MGDTTQAATEQTSTASRTETFPQDVKTAEVKDAAATTTETTTDASTTQVDAAKDQSTTEVKADATADAATTETSTTDKKDGAADSSKETKTEIAYDLKVPENSFISDARVQELTKLAKDNGLTNEQAQSLVNVEHDAVTRFAKAQVDEFNKLKAGWKNEVQADKDFGGDKYRETVAVAHEFVKNYAPQSLIAELEKTGYGDYPDLVKMFAKAGRDLESAKFIPSRSASKTPQSKAEKWYGKE